MKKILSVMAVTALLVAASSSAFAGEEAPKSNTPEELKSIRLVRASETGEAEGDFAISYTIATEAAGKDGVAQSYFYQWDSEDGEEAFTVSLGAVALDMRELVTDNEELTDVEKETLLTLLDEAQPLEDQISALYEQLPEIADDADEKALDALLTQIDELHDQIEAIYDREAELFEKAGLGRAITITCASVDGETFFINGEEVDFVLFEIDDAAMFEINDDIVIETVPANAVTVRR